jgi:hypothetical protein
MSKPARTKHLIDKLEAIARELHASGQYLHCRQLVELLRSVDRFRAVALRDELFSYEQGQP